VKLIVFLASIALLPLAQNATTDSTWLQWGGPRRDFIVRSPTLAASWPASGPKKLWTRALGEGHSAFVGDNGRVYTMYRPAGQRGSTSHERVIAMDAATGKTIWEHSYEEPTSGLDFSEGAGPHATPLIVGDRLYTVSSRMNLMALDKATGKPVWSHDLMKEYGARLDGRGYSSSPVAYRQTIIVPAGAANGGSVLAFDQATGALAWKGGSFPVGAASPIVIAVQGQEQLVVTGADEVVGMNPSNGTVLWRHPHSTSWGLNISTPVFVPGDSLFFTAAYNNGSRLLKLAQANGKTTVSEQWFQNRMRVHIGTVIRIGGFVVGSSGDFGPCPTVGLDLATGKILWQSREFARSTYLFADDKLIVLDEDGTLGLARVSPQGMQVLARTSLLTNRAWTVPTLVGTKLYVRDRRQAVALELGG
jgi:outer membrane protein assembly factor BamB